MIQGWQEKIDAAQKGAVVELGGSAFERVRYGVDYPNGKDECRDCAVKHGQFHVVGCCVERCPRCRGQALSCLCRDDDATGAVH